MSEQLPSAEEIQEFDKMATVINQALAARDKEWVAGGDKILADVPMITSTDALGYDFYIKQKWQQLKKTMGVSQ